VTGSTTSAAYCGHVVHARTRPRKHRLRYSVFYLLLDLAELPALEKRLRLFAHNRRGLFSFHDRDHGPRDGSDLRTWVDNQLAQAGLPIPGGRVKLLCLPRILGYVFNPLSVYFCFDRNGNLRAVLYQVSNTFAQSHTYVLPVDDAAAAERIVRHEFDKTFYVSPFIPMACRYHIALRNPDEHASIAIRETDSDGDLLAATFHGERRELDDAFFVQHPVEIPAADLQGHGRNSLGCREAVAQADPGLSPPATAVSHGLRYLSDRNIARCQSSRELTPRPMTRTPSARSATGSSAASSRASSPI